MNRVVAKDAHGVTHAIMSAGPRGLVTLCEARLAYLSGEKLQSGRPDCMTCLVNEARR